MDRHDVISITPFDMEVDSRNRRALPSSLTRTRSGPNCDLLLLDGAGFRRPHGNYLGANEDSSAEKLRCTTY